MYKFIGSLERSGGLHSSCSGGRDEWNHASQLWTVETISLAINRCAVTAGAKRR